jgi:hypothetical protein
MSKAELVAAVQKALGKEASSAQAERAVDAVIQVLLAIATGLVIDRPSVSHSVTRWPPDLNQIDLGNRSNRGSSD